MAVVRIPNPVVAAKVPQATSSLYGSKFVARLHETFPSKVDIQYCTVYVNDPTRAHL